jgi:hypothetical protein
VPPWGEGLWVVSGGEDFVAATEAGLLSVVAATEAGLEELPPLMRTCVECLWRKGLRCCHGGRLEKSCLR